MTAIVTTCLPIPLLGANVKDTATGEPYFRPYAVIERDGVRFAVLGLLTPAIPAWLPEELWSGMEVTDMVESARRWVEHIRRHERPDMVIGLFHSGYESTHLTGKWLENASGLVAREVEGIDLIFMGHDHLRAVRRESTGILLLNPGAHARLVAEATVTADVAPTAVWPYSTSRATSCGSTAMPPTPHSWPSLNRNAHTRSNWSDR